APRHTGNIKGVIQLPPARMRILRGCRETGGSRVLEVGRCAVCYEHGCCSGPACKLRAAADGLIVRMRDDDANLGRIHAIEPLVEQRSEAAAGLCVARRSQVETLRVVHGFPSAGTHVTSYLRAESRLVRKCRCSAGAVAADHAGAELGVFLRGE